MSDVLMCALCSVDEAMDLPYTPRSYITWLFTDDRSEANTVT